MCFECVVHVQVLGARGRQSRLTCFSMTSGQMRIDARRCEDEMDFWVGVPLSVDDGEGSSLWLWLAAAIGDEEDADVLFAAAATGAIDDGLSGMTQTKRRVGCEKACTRWKEV